jgi:hypothetical protein
MTHFEIGYITFMKLAGLADDTRRAATQAARSGVRAPHLAAAALGTGALAKGYQELTDQQAETAQLEQGLPPAYWAMTPENQQLLAAFNAQH